MKFCVLPQPAIFEVLSEDTVFSFDEFTQYICPDECMPALDELINFLKKVYDISPMGIGSHTVRFFLDDSVENREGYTLTVERANISVACRSPVGALWAVQTLKQLLVQGRLNLPQIKIIDCPVYEYRAFMLDCCSYFFTLEAVEVIIDLLSLHKLNVLHLRLTGDQGWRIEIYRHLLLAQIGGFRSHTGLGSVPHGGFYSKTDIEKLISYAKSKGVTIIPEIDGPGRATAAIAAYPELSCLEKEIKVATDFRKKSEVLCLGKESTFDFMFDVFGEVLEMFDNKIIHIGALSAPTKKWQACPNCQKLIKNLSLTDEKQLCGYYAERITQFLTANGARVIARPDDAGDMMPAGVIQQCRDLLRVKSGKVILSPPEFSFTLPATKKQIKTAYEYEPKKNKNINLLGFTAELWTQNAPSMHKVSRITVPRLGAFSELVWSKKENRSFQRFEEKQKLYKKMLSTIPF